MKKRVASLLIAVLMICAMIPLAAIPAVAADTAVTEYYCLDVGSGAYIDTGVVPTKNTRVVIDMEQNKVTETALFGLISDSFRGYGLYSLQNGQFWYYYGDGGTIDAGKLTTGRHTVETDKNVVRIDGVQTYADTALRDISAGGRTMYIFAVNTINGNQSSAWSSISQYIRFYSCKIYEGDNLVRDFVPARKGTDVGVYDKAGKKFYAKQGGGVMEAYIPAYTDLAEGSELPSGTTHEGFILDFDGTIVVSQDTEINGLPGQSAIRIADGRNVTIKINPGVTLTVRGGDADGRHGAGAGIEVPETSSLTISGDGMLNAYGGNAAVGANGGEGARGSVDETWCISGTGGNGGNGGGGAGAGIGGRGGDGGLGGNGGASVKAKTQSGSIGTVIGGMTETAMANGVAGTAGKNGTAGGGCGNITITNTLKTVNAIGGKSSEPPSFGGMSGSHVEKKWWFTFMAFGGGGGGGGGNGYGAADIGSGGAGAGGGGGGGSGLIVYWFDPWGTSGAGHGGIGGAGSQIGQDNNGGGIDVETHTEGLVSGAGGSGGKSGGGEGVAKFHKNLTPIILKTYTNLVYNGKEQIGVDAPGQNLKLAADVSGNKATEAGTYTATLTVHDGYCWEDGSVEPLTIEWTIEKATVIPPLSYSYIGTEISFATSDLYVAEYTKGINEGKYPVKLTMISPNHKWQNSNDPVIDTFYDIHVYIDADNNGICDKCGESIRYLFDIPYLCKSVNSDNTVSTEEKRCEVARAISEGDTEWGISGKTTWYVLDKAEVILEKRPVVNGDVHIILMNGATLIADKGITAEGENNSLSFYAQTDKESEMGKLIANTKGVTAIGGGNGVKGADGKSSVTGCHGNVGEDGGNCCDIRFYGGNFSLKSENAACVGGGNGGNGGNGILYMDYEIAGDGGNGGNGGMICFYDGIFTFESIHAVCLGGGRGGIGGNGGPNRGDIVPGDGGNGGDGGNSGIVSLYGGNVSFRSSGESVSDICIGGGGYGSGGNSVGYTYLKGQSGSIGDTGKTLDNCCLIFGSVDIKAGADEQKAGRVNKYTDEKYLSVQYGGTSGLGSVLSEGSLTIIVGVAALVLGLGGGFFLRKVVEKKKKQPALADGAEKETDGEE